MKEELEEEARAKARAARENLYSPDSQPKRRKKRRTKREKELEVDPLPKRVLCQLCGKDYPRDDIKVCFFYYLNQNVCKNFFNFSVTLIEFILRSRGLSATCVVYYFMVKIPLFFKILS